MLKQSDFDLYGKMAVGVFVLILLLYTWQYLVVMLAIVGAGYIYAAWERNDRGRGGR